MGEAIKLLIVQLYPLPYFTGSHILLNTLNIKQHVKLSIIPTQFKNRNYFADIKNMPEIKLKRSYVMHYISLKVHTNFRASTIT
jgi:hypothetical protein